MRYDHDTTVNEFDAVIMNIAIGRVHLVHMISANQCQAAASPQPNCTVSLPLGCCCPHLSSPFIIVAHPES